MPEPTGPLTRAAPLRASSWSADTLSFDIVLSAGSAVDRRDSRGVFAEVLDIAGATWPDTIPLLADHRQDLDNNLGDITKIRREGGEIVGTVLLSKHSEKAKRIAAELSDGRSFSASIGYAVNAWAESKPQGKRTLTAKSWLIQEASLVSVPADPSAKIRSTPLTTETTTTQTRGEINTQIRAAAKAAGLDQAFVDQHIDADSDMATVNAAALAALSARTAAAGSVRTVQVGVDHSDPEAIRTAMSDALAHRIAPGAVKLEGRAVEFGGHTMLDMVGDLAIARGERVNLRDRDGLLKRAVGAHSSSDLPLLLADSAQKSLLAQYQIAVPTYRKWAAKKTFNSWTPQNFLRVGDVPAFKEIQEGGEVQYGTISESGEKIALKEFTSGIALSRRMIAQDNLSALSDLSSGFATRAANDENRLVYGVLKANPTMSDGNALFSSAHGNLPTAAAFGATPIAAMVKALRGQTSLDGMPLNLGVAMLVVGSDLEVPARTLLAAVNATKTSDVNPWASFAELVVDSNPGATEFYIFASPTAAPAFVYGYLAGEEGPQVRAEVEFDTLATKIAATLSFGYGAIDFRPVVKNAGA
ncbi:MAG: Mu-like prophage major head subunit gpT family protein [Allorhizobium sp.]